jgi:hypothetical protein
MTLRTFFCCLYAVCCLVLLALLMTACSPAPAVVAEAGSAPPQAAAPTISTKVVQRHQPTMPPAPTRRATLSELANEVLARLAAAADFSAAREGDAVTVGGLVRTGLEGKVRLTFTEGTIVRLGPNSEFIVAEVSPEAAEPFTRLRLVAGQVWVILTGGSLEVETPVGVASVRGSYLGVSYDPQTQVVVITCLEGECGLRNDRGEVALSDGQSSSAGDDGLPPSPPEPLSADDIKEWIEVNPEAEAVVEEVYPDGTPTPPADGGSGDSGDPLPPLVYTITNGCQISKTINYSGPESGTLALAPGETAAGELPPGQYTFTEGGESVVWDSSAGELVGRLCDEPAPTGGGQPKSTPAAVTNSQPLQYTLTHNCPPDPQSGASREGVWVWTFENVTLAQTFTISVNPGSTESGELPPGHYRVSDYDNTGPLESGELDSDRDRVYVMRCGQLP